MTERRWRVREYESGDEERIVPLFNQVFGEYPGFEPRAIAFWKWQYADHPLGHHTFVAEAEDGSLIGNFSGLRTPYCFRGERRMGSQTVDLCVRRDYRGAGVLAALGSEYFRRFDDPVNDFVAFGYPAPASYKTVTKYLSYLPVHCPVSSFVHRLDSIWVGEVWRSAARRVVNELPRLDDRVERLWGRLRDGYQLATWRDREYLHWRYESQPSVRYHYLATLDPAGEIEGLLVVRSGWLGHRVMPLVEWLVPRQNAAVSIALVARAAQIALAEGLERLETWLPPGSPERASLASLGFTDEQSSFNLVVRHSHGLFTADWAKEHWFYTMGDTDFY